MASLGEGLVQCDSNPSSWTLTTGSMGVLSIADPIEKAWINKSRKHLQIIWNTTQEHYNMTLLLFSFTIFKSATIRCLCMGGDFSPIWESVTKIVAKKICSISHLTQQCVDLCDTKTHVFLWRKIMSPQMAPNEKVSFHRKAGSALENNAHTHFSMTTS